MPVTLKSYRIRNRSFGVGERIPPLTSGEFHWYPGTNGVFLIFPESREKARKDQAGCRFGDGDLRLLSRDEACSQTSTLEEMRLDEIDASVTYGQGTHRYFFPHQCLENTRIYVTVHLFVNQNQRDPAGWEIEQPCLIN